MNPQSASNEEQNSGSIEQALAAASRARRSVRRFAARLTEAIPDQPWRLVIAALVVFVPSAILSVFGPNLPVTTPGVVLLVAVAFSTYLADMAGGAAALILSALVLDFFFIGDHARFDLPGEGVQIAGLIVTLASGVGLIWLIQRIKNESLVARQDAMAARAAATALTSVEIAAASHARGASEDPRALNNALLRALVSVNRAHAGVLYLAGEDGCELERAADYGLESLMVDPGAADTESAIFATQLATEKRSRSIADLGSERRLAHSVFAQANLKAVLGVPLIDENDRLLGVALIGLLVPHRFTRTEIARVEALASRAAAMIYAAHGIDERETALNSVRATLRRLELVIGAMPEAVVLAEPPDGHIIAENQAAISLLGRGGNPITATKWPANLFLPDGSIPNRADLPIETALRTGEVVSGLELLIRSASGVEIPVLVSAAPVKDPGGPTIAVVAVFREIAALKEASRLKDEFVSVVSHELRSPLTPIRGFVQLVARDLAREGGHDSHVARLNSIAGHVDRMTRLVDDLLDVSRLKAGSLEIRNRRTDMLELAEEVVRDRDAANSTHEIVLVTGPDPVIGDWDSDRLYQVLDNLIGNALKYSPAGGIVTVTAGSDPKTGDALVSVADEGAGISPDDRERIFSAFYRSREATASQIAGLGLGLYICHELVAAHGGRLEVRDAPVRGAEFLIRLPRTTPMIPIAPIAAEMMASGD